SMSDFDRNIAARGSYGAGTAAVVDAGLRAYIIRYYTYRAAGVGLAGVFAWLTYNAAVVTGPNGAITGLTSFGQAIFSGPLAIVLFIVTLGVVVFISLRTGVWSR